MDRNEAINIVKSYYPANKQMLNEALEFLIPELKESEDEKIRNGLIALLKFGLEDGSAIAPGFNETKEEAIAWLEKQGEQKSVDKVEPKFKVGDWVVYDHRVYQVVELPKEGYINLGLKRNGKIEFAPSTYCRHWTIQDAKDGDVLYSIDSKQPFIYKERQQFGQAIGYCCINKFGEFAIWNTSKCLICTDKYIPATKEQRDLLFSKMHEAGYEWDADKKELKKIEDTPTLPFDSEPLTEFERAFQGMCSEKNKPFAKDCCKVLLVLARKQIYEENKEAMKGE